LELYRRPGQRQHKRSWRTTTKTRGRAKGEEEEEKKDDSHQTGQQQPPLIFYTRPEYVEEQRAENWGVPKFSFPRDI
jgi:hypothetical protein